MTNLARLITFYEANLSLAGQVVTDMIGLGWMPPSPPRRPRWRFDFDDLAAVAEIVGLEASLIDRFV